MSEYVWIDGEIVKADKAVIPISCLGFQMGMSIFEAIRAYKHFESDKIHCFKLDSHINRLFQSAKITRINNKYTRDQIIKGLKELMVANKINNDTYIKLMLFCSSSSVGSSIFDPNSVEYKLLITTSSVNKYKGLSTIRCSISSWQRINDNSVPPRVKAIANYQNTRLAGYDAVLNGYDNCILLNNSGNVSEAGESAVFIYRNNKLITPNTSSSILESITRNTIIKIANEILNIPVEEKPVERTELYLSDEIFLVNTAKLIRAVVEVDKYLIGDGCIGSITKKIEDLFLKVARREIEICNSWYNDMI